MVEPSSLPLAPSVAVLHGAVAADAPPDELDVLVEVDAVREALSELGYAPAAVPLTLDLEATARRLRDLRPAFVFNIVESVEGLGRLAHLSQSLLDSMGLRYTGAGGDAAFSTANKLVAKRLLTAAGIPTPPWVEARGDELMVPDFPGPYIVKSVWEHASIGLDSGSVAADPAALPAILRRRRRDHGGDWFVERFIDGRELNLSLLTRPGGVEVLPPAEIRFLGEAGGTPAILGYAAKWDEASREYRDTPRSFEFPPGDRPLLDRLESIARDCWRLFGLTGYARVDYRITPDGRPWVLEINTNPCLSPNAGFAAAAARVGLSLSAVVRRIVADLSGNAAAPPTEPLTAVTIVADAASTAGGPPGLVFRDEVAVGDVGRILDLVRSSAFFSPDEAAVAAELVEARLAQGESSGYSFCFVERDGRVLGYSCFGRIPLTRSSYDLYWIVVDPAVQRGGVGRSLMRRTEAAVARLGGTAVYVETSSRPQYGPTRRFYEAVGYREIAQFRDFYAPGDSKIVYEKVLSARDGTQALPDIS